VEHRPKFAQEAGEAVASTCQLQFGEWSLTKLGFCNGRRAREPQQHILGVLLARIVRVCTKAIASSPSAGAPWAA